VSTHRVSLNVPFNYTPNPNVPRPWWKYTIIECVDDGKSYYAIIDKNETDKMPFDGGNYKAGWLPEALWPYERPVGRDRKRIDREQAAIRKEIMQYLERLDAADNLVYGPRWKGDTLGLSPQVAHVITQHTEALRNHLTLIMRNRRVTLPYTVI
jgi:hypothetical protein